MIGLRVLLLLVARWYLLSESCVQWVLAQGRELVLAFAGVGLGQVGHRDRDLSSLCKLRSLLCQCKQVLLHVLANLLICVSLP